MELLNHETEKMFEIQKYKKEYNDSLLIFLRTCLPESGRRLELHGRHKMYGNIEAFFEDFWCLFNGKNIIGTVALKRLDEDKCELKSLYLLRKYHGRKTGISSAEKSDIQSTEQRLQRNVSGHIIHKQRSYFSI